MSLSRSSLSPTVVLFPVYISCILPVSLCLLAISPCCKTRKYCTELSKQDYHLLGSDSNLSDLLSTANSSGFICVFVHSMFRKYMDQEGKGTGQEQAISIKRNSDCKCLKEKQPL